MRRFLPVAQTAQPVEKLPPLREWGAFGSEKRHHEPETWPKPTCLRSLTPFNETEFGFFNRLDRPYSDS